MAERIAARPHPNAPAAFGNLISNLVVAALSVWFLEAIGALDRDAGRLVAVGIVLVATLSWLEVAFWRSLVIGETPRSRTNPGYVTLSMLLSVIVLASTLTVFAIVWGIHLLFS